VGGSGVGVTVGNGRVGDGVAVGRRVGVNCTRVGGGVSCARLMAKVGMARVDSTGNAARVGGGCASGGDVGEGAVGEDNPVVLCCIVSAPALFISPPAGNDVVGNAARVVLVG
jgi:hypothetical protein